MIWTAIQPQLQQFASAFGQSWFLQLVPIEPDGVGWGGMGISGAGEVDELAHTYGDLPLEKQQSAERARRHRTPVVDVTSEVAGKVVLVRGRVLSSRGKGKLAFLVVRESGSSVQCVASVGDSVSKGLVKYVSTLNKESSVEVEGLVVIPAQPIDSTTQPVGQKNGPVPARPTTGMGGFGS